MAGGGGGGNTRELDQTPTWAVASVCGVIVLISILLEKGLHHIGEFFSHRKKKAMVEALEKVKAELMVLGFISLLLVFGQNYIIKICITEEAADTMLPCKLKKGAEHLGGVLGRPQAPYYAAAAFSPHPHRLLAEANMKAKCHEGKVSLISINALHQLHIFIFFLAVFHVMYSAITMALGRAKIRGWKEWEKEAAGQDDEFSNDPTRFRFTHETSFVRQHMNVLNKTPASFYISNFFRQFFRSVRKADYCALRHSFVNVHLAPGSKFDFQKYIKRSLEDDFKVIVGISPPLWASALTFLFLNVYGWHTMLWISIMPVVIILSVGTKLQGIICRMAIDITERHAVIQGIPLVQVSDQYFWFARPTFVLFLIHFTLFQNGFQIIYFLWILYEYGLDSCFNESNQFVFARLCLGVVVQFLCSYVTLPLYALVSQMGSTMKQSIFDDQTSKALKNWRAGVKKKAPNSNSKHGGHGSPTAGSPTRAAADSGIALT
ncbi:MLO-like protein 9 isoform X2 [Phragmites australis]|uniref:MLO-like protein 9 isoform X2 n=1 Tax=Phragmites australis TaxID=29695 RepID=UPI002D77241B|nr:MLO-like protein 9 isoform X2 [Phragmites australis]